MSDDAQNQALSDITQAVMGLLDSWDLYTREIQGVLCLPENVRARALNKFREGTDVLPEDPAVLRRAGYLLRISDALRTTYPLNKDWHCCYNAAHKWTGIYLNIR